MAVTVSPIGAAHVISAPSTFPRFLGRFASIAPAQAAPLDLNIGPGRTDSGVVVVYEGQVDVKLKNRCSLALFHRGANLDPNYSLHRALIELTLGMSEMLKVLGSEQ